MRLSCWISRHFEGVCVVIKNCNRCKTEKHVSCFCKNEYGKNGYKSICKKCEKEKRQQKRIEKGLPPDGTRRKSYIQKKCEYCEKVFTIEKNSKEKYCSLICKKEIIKKRSNKYKTKKCPICGTDCNITRKYCSQKCYFKSRFPNGAKTIQCKMCGKTYFKRGCGKIYCSQECYYNDPETKERFIKQFKNNQKRIPYVCDCCKKPIILRVCESKLSKRHFCNNSCYRQWMSDRFDRYIKSNLTIKELNNYDEFLSKESLPCLVDGCDWEGMSLSNHMNFEHGINKDEFKKLAGFNVQTGVVTPEVSKKISEKAKNRFIPQLFKPGHKNIGPKNGPLRPFRKEGQEHVKKALFLRSLNYKKGDNEL